MLINKKDETVADSLVNQESDTPYGDKSLNAIISLTDDEVDNLFYELEELKEVTNEDNWCDGCCHIYTDYENDEYWGTPCRRPVINCVAEFDPDDSSCPKYEEYKKNLDRIKEIEMTLKGAGYEDVCI